MNSRKTVFTILNEIEQKDNAVESVVDQVLNDAELDRRDRRLVYEIVMGVIRQRGAIDYLIDHFLSDVRYRENSELRSILRIGFYQILYLDRIPDHAAVNESVTLAKSRRSTRDISGVVNAVLRNLIKQKGRLPQPSELESLSRRLSVKYSHPEWMIERWLSNIGLARTKKLLEFNNTRPSVFLRRKIRGMSRQQFDSDARGLCDAGMGFMNLYYRLKKPFDPETLELFRDGACTVQAPSSGWVVAVLEVQKNDRICDLAAAPGGKTSLISELVSDGGAVAACDIRFSRLMMIRETADRMRLGNIYEVLCDGAHSPFAGKFDKVLLDAPCTSTGIMHRHPEIRWRRTPDDIEMCAAKQAELLDSASRLVVRGGTLVFSVCSLEPEEGPAQVRSFLERHPYFRLVPPPGSIPKMYIDDNDCLSISPYKHGMDGMFAARFERIARSKKSSH